jgi:hypothetical protein
VTAPEERTRPPWDWRSLTSEEFEREVEALVSWVGWLETTYAPWVELPPCWPLHESLRNELALFWYRHRYVYGAAGDPAEGIRWHQDLRSSAAAWHALSGCEHRAPLRHQQALDDRRRVQVRSALRRVLEGEG